MMGLKWLIGVTLNSNGTGSKLRDRIDEVIDKVAYRLVLEPGDKDHNDRILWYDAGGENVRTFTADPHVGVFKRLLIGLTGLLPIESQL